jgi:hypothetical protein
LGVRRNASPRASSEPPVAMNGGAYGVGRAAEHL